MPDFDDVEKMADDHEEQVDQGLEKVGNEAEDKIGHQDQVDKAVDWAQEKTGSGDTTD